MQLSGIYYVCDCTNLLYLKRTELKKSIIDGSEVLQVAKDIPVVVSERVCLLFMRSCILLCVLIFSILCVNSYP